MKTPHFSRRSMGKAIVGGSLGLLGMAQLPGFASSHPGVGRGGSIKDHLAIDRLIQRYALAIDRLDTEAFRSCFARNAVLQGKNIRFEGDFAREVIDAHRQIDQTMHLVLNRLHDVEGRMATGITYGVAIWIQRKNARLSCKKLYMRYGDELAKEGKDWVFVKRQADVLFTTEGPTESFDSDLREGRSR